MAKDTETHLIPSQSDGSLTVEEILAWQKAQVNEPNLAGTEGFEDGKVKTFVEDVLRENEDAMRAVYLKWRLANHLLRGNSVVPTPVADVHVPEVQKALEVKVPRLVDGVLDHDKPFQVKGMDEADKENEEVMEAFLQWQLRQMRFDRKVEPAARSMDTYQVAVMKMRWHREWTTRKKRKLEKNTGKNGSVAYKVQVQEIIEWVYDGPKGDLVDPFDFIIDPFCADKRDATYIGDRMFMTLEEIEHQAELGTYSKKGARELRESRGTKRDQRRGGGDFTTASSVGKMARSITGTTPAFRQSNSGGAEKIEVVELWCAYNISHEENGKAEECVLTVAKSGGSQVLLQARRNPYDRKVRPYAIARSAKEGWDFFNQSPLDAAVRLNEEMDRHRATALRSSEINVSMVMAPAGSDLPDNLNDVVPGRIFKGVGNLETFTIPDTSASSIRQQEVIRQDIEDVTGASRLLQGGEGGNTALEVDVRSRESNKRIAGEIRNLGDLLDDALEIMSAFNMQFLIPETKFRVLGKAAKRLGEYSVAGPDTFLQRVDFDLAVATSLNTRSLMATRMSTFAQVFGPMLISESAKGEFHMNDFLRANYETMVSRDTRFFPDKTKPQDLLSQEEELEMLLNGQDVPVDPEDDDNLHLEIIEQAGLMPSLGERPPGPQFEEQSWENQAAITAHVLNHLHNIAKKRSQAQAVARQQERAGGAPPAPEGGGASAVPEAGGTQTPPGSVPGPPVDQQATRAGREAPLPREAVR